MLLTYNFNFDCRNFKENIFVDNRTQHIIINRISDIFYYLFTMEIKLPKITQNSGNKKYIGEIKATYGINYLEKSRRKTDQLFNNELQSAQTISHKQIFKGSFLQDNKNDF